MARRQSGGRGRAGSDRSELRRSAGRLVRVSRSALAELAGLEAETLSTDVSFSRRARRCSLNPLAARRCEPSLNGRENRLSHED